MISIDNKNEYLALNIALLKTWK